MAEVQKLDEQWQRMGLSRHLLDSRAETPARKSRNGMTTNEPSALNPSYDNLAAQLAPLLPKYKAWTST